MGGRPLPKVETVAPMPDAYATTPEIKGQPLTRWCSDFGAPALEVAVTRAFADNLNLKAGWARLAQSLAIQRQADANLYPTLDLEAQATRLKQPGFPIPFEGNQYRGSLAAGYEVDLWGRLAAQRQAAAADVEAARADAQALAMSLTSEVAEAWFDVIYQRQRLALIEDQIDINARYLELLMLRLAQGSATGLDVNQQQQQIEALQAQVASAQAAQEAAALRLAQLLGRGPDAALSLAGDGALLPEVGPLPDVGVPADLLERRPDLRAASARLEAANARIAVAVRARLPALRLSASLFLGAIDPARLLDELFWSVAAAASQPLFQGGRMSAEVELAEARQQEVLFSYGHTLLGAMNDVQAAMVREQRQQEAITVLQRQRERADEALELARARYQSGAVDFLRVLTAIQALQSIEQGVLDAQRNQLSNRVQLCRALGGTWTRELSAPDLKAEANKESR